MLDEINGDWEDDSRVLFCRDSVEGLQVAELEENWTHGKKRVLANGSPPDTRVCSNKVGVWCGILISFLGWVSDMACIVNLYEYTEVDQNIYNKVSTLQNQACRNSKMETIVHETKTNCMNCVQACKRETEVMNSLCTL